MAISGSPRIGFPMNECLKWVTTSLFSTSWTHLLHLQPSPYGWCVEGSARQAPHSGPKCPIANMYLVLIVWERVYGEVQRDHCILVASTLVSWLLFDWICLLSCEELWRREAIANVRVASFSKDLRACFERLLFSRSCSHIFLFNLQAMATHWEENIGDRVLCIMREHNKRKLVAYQSHENLRVSPS